jgi:uncharacterized SAM-binding protein YcdF (DUF218 family)
VTPAIVVPGTSLARTRERLVRTAERLVVRVHAELVVFSGLGEAEHMRGLWQGPPVELVTEMTATSTVENAARTAPLLVERGVHEAVVVAAPVHLARAGWIFRRVYARHGIQVRLQAARVPPTPGAVVWELVAATVARRQVKDHT